VELPTITEPRPSAPETPVEGVVALDSARPLGVRSHGLTDRGRKRPGNEDQFLIADLGKALHICQSSFEQQAVHFSEPQGRLFVVADGVGGTAGGQKASALAVDVVEHVILDSLHCCHRGLGTDPTKCSPFEKALTQADSRVVSEGRDRPELHGMGTTLTLAYVTGRDLYLAHVGDSRCYLLRDRLLHRLTRDHTLVEDMMRRGLLTPEQAAHHGWRHVITNVVGGAEEGVEVEVHRLPLLPGDRMLLCSDGLSEMVPETEIQSILDIEAEPEVACRRLIERANERGGKDNITAVVVRFDEA
jgi:protein phosphatase